MSSRASWDPLHPWFLIFSPVMDISFPRGKSKSRSEREACPHALANICSALKVCGRFFSAHVPLGFGMHDFQVLSAVSTSGSMSGCSVEKSESWSSGGKAMALKSFR